KVSWTSRFASQAELARRVSIVGALRGYAPPCARSQCLSAPALVAGLRPASGAGAIRLGPTRGRLRLRSGRRVFCVTCEGSPVADEAIISLKGVTKSFGSHTVLQDITFDVP